MDDSASLLTSGPRLSHSPTSANRSGANSLLSQAMHRPVGTITFALNQGSANLALEYKCSSGFLFPW